MRASLRFGIAAAAAGLALAPAPLAAQVAVTPGQTSENTIGPAQLEDFSLDGTVIRRAEPGPDSVPAPRTQSAPIATASQQTAEPAPVRSAPERTAEREPRAEPAARPEQAPATRSAALDLGRPSPAGPLFSPAPILSGTPASEPTPYAPVQSYPEPGSGFSLYPWLLALLLLGGGAFYYFRRQRPGLAFAGGPRAAEFAAPEPAPPRRPPTPAPVPAPAPPALPVGIVSTRLRPWLDIQFKAERVVLEGERALVEFEVLVENSGSAPAREFLVEAAMFNAGPEQDKAIGAFFERPVGQGERVPTLAPLKSMAFRSTVHLRRDQLSLFKAGDRTVFVPLIGLNVLYRWAGGDAQTSASFLIGKETKGDRLAPFRADQGPRTFAGVAARELELKVRK